VKESGLPVEKTAFKVAIAGSGPAGLAAAWRLNQLGHSVTVFEKQDQFGGLLMYGIPNMKLDKKIVRQRIKVMQEVGIKFIANTEVGADITAHELQNEYDRVVLAIGAGIPRDLVVPGRHFRGIHFAVDFLTEVTKEILATKSLISKKLSGKKVVVIGGGDTGNDCIATAIRLGADSVEQLEITPELAESRSADNPWPEYPMVKKQGYGQAEANFLYQKDITHYSTSTLSFLGDSHENLIGLEIAEVDSDFTPKAGTTKTIEADLVLLAMGFLGSDQNILKKFGVNEIFDNYATDNELVYVAGDARRGPSLVIWAIKEGREAGQEIDHVLRTIAVQ